MPEKKIKTECDRCGTCCTKGGPTLHCEDRTLLLNNWLHLEHLITIRKGEPVSPLLNSNPEPAQSEMIKIKGRGAEWTCLFLQQKENKCLVYEHRPLECALLKCWETSGLEKVAGRDLLSRFAIIATHDPIFPLIQKHENICSLENLPRILSALGSRNSQQSAVTELTGLVNTDLAIRSQAFARFHVSLDLELFFFGRPLFKILDQFGITTHEKNGFCRLELPASLPSAMLSNLFAANQNR